jgi:hypothetical protein
MVGGREGDERKEYSKSKKIVFNISKLYLSNITFLAR